MGESLSIQGLDEMFRRMDGVLEDFPDRKKQVLGGLGSRMEEVVRGQVVGQGVNDARGHVRNRQRYEVGSEGGYVAVRPVKGSLAGKKIDSRELTRYLERGHGLPLGQTPSGLDGRRSGINDKTGLGYVSGFYFYSFARMRLGLTLKRHARSAAERLLREAAERMAGRDA